MGKHHDPDTDTYVAHTLRASGFDASEDGTGRGTPLIAESVALRGREGGATAELGGDSSFALRASQGGGDKPYLLTMREGKDGGGKGPLVSEDQSLTLATGNGQTLFASSVRRLTPTECERLQGFPDGWTCLCDTDVCTCPDGPRYAALGNAVTVNVAEWIGHRIRMSEQ
jgi:DNA (cytosine-5)-methyltransferase 1